jgi:hypothetical protein
VKIKHCLLILAGFFALLGAIREAESCSVPVFRYALERWRPDPYKGIYIHEGALSQQEKALLERLEAASSNGESPLNLLVREVDTVTFSKEKLTELLQGPVPQGLPLLVIWRPDQMGKTPPVWKEKLTPSLVEGLIYSPKRQQLAEKLIRGESVVWVFVPSGNGKKDAAAEKLLREELDSALATYSRNPFSVLSGGSQKRLPYGFPILKLSADDPAERIFIDTLLASESDLRQYTDEPMVFPVFGRGRVLGCLFGEFITAKHIRESTAFLAGACSCEVKDLNPGVDLLLAAPWDMVVMDAFVQDTPLPELTGVLPADTPVEAGMTATAAEAPPAVAAAVIPEPGPARKRSSGILKVYGITLGSALAIVLCAAVFLQQRRKKDL